MIRTTRGFSLRSGRPSEAIRDGRSSIPCRRFSRSRRAGSCREYSQTPAPGTGHLNAIGHCGWPSSRRRPRRSPPLAGLCRPPPAAHHAPGRALARRELELRAVGRTPRNLSDDRAHPPRGREGGSRKLDHAARLAQGYLDLRVGERDLGLLPIAVARGHPHGLAEAAVPRQRRLAWWFVPQCSRCPRWSWGDSSPGGGNGGSPSWRRGTRCSRPSWYSGPSSCSSSPPWTARPSFTFSSEAGGTRDRASPSRAILVLIDHQGDSDPALFVGRHRRIVEGAHANGLHSRELHALLGEEAPHRLDPALG